MQNLNTERGWFEIHMCNVDFGQGHEYEALASLKRRLTV